MREAAQLGLGCAPLGNMFSPITDDDARGAIDAAWDAGIRFFDAAPLYGHGLSEQRLGAALQNRPRDETTIATKVGRLLVPGVDPRSIFVDVPPVRPVFDFSYDATMRSLEESLERMGVDRVDLLHVHDPDNHGDDALAGAFPALRRLRDEKVVGAIGAGMNQSAMLARFVREADVDCVLVAGRFTLLDQSALHDLLPLALEKDVSVIAAGVFNSGLLADPKPGARYDYAPAPAALVERALSIAAICADHDVPLRAAALQFPLRHPAVTRVLTGARTAAEITQNVADFQRPIPDELWTALGAYTHSK
ncbi:MAG TPA: aldo/keto reductase [Acidimicrobiales bacterium]|nr:aldo/keto reductase [Acidimicrobiales bacterium]